MIEVTPHDYRRMSELLSAYASLRLQAVDACVIALAERFDLREVATLDQRDYLVVAPRHLPKGQRLTILPGDWSALARRQADGAARAGAADAAVAVRRLEKVLLAVALRLRQKFAASVG
ncbi:hypothetical protein [Microbispora rosea]|uniref:hypothetical protein n=2 Tax=Microbispora rosea TaxID=58117 RepID=UPI00379183DF